MHSDTDPSSASRRPWRTTYMPALVGLAEAVDILSIKKSTLSSWLQPGSGNGQGQGDDDLYMIPPAIIKATPLWAKADVEKFRDEHGTRRTPSADFSADDLASRRELWRLRPWRTGMLPELAGMAEAMELLDVSKITIGRWRKPGSGNGDGQWPDDTFIVPPFVVKAGPVWVKSDLERFAVDIGRRRRKSVPAAT